MKTEMIITIDHDAPIDPEKVGFAISESLKPIMEQHNKRYRSMIKRSAVTIISHNVPERTAIEVPPEFKQ